MRMDREIFIHVGLPKTGSTWLQHSYFPKLDLILIKYKKDFKIIPKKGKILISNESLSGSPRSSVKFRYYLTYGLKKSYPNAKIILGLREKKSWLKSLYNQGVKRGIYNVSYKKWLNNFDLGLCDFDSYVKLLTDQFDDVFIYWFKDFRENKAGVLKDMCDFLGVDFQNFDDSIKNPSYYDLTEQIFLFFNKFCMSFRIFIMNVSRLGNGVKNLKKKFKIKN